MLMSFNPEEIDDLDESLLEKMDQEELTDFREKLQETMDEMESFPPDPDKEEEAYYEWQDRINVLQDLIDVIDMQVLKKEFALTNSFGVFRNFWRVLNKDDESMQKTGKVFHNQKSMSGGAYG